MCHHPEVLLENGVMCPALWSIGELNELMNEEALDGVWRSGCFDQSGLISEAQGRAEFMMVTASQALRSEAQLLKLHVAVGSPSPQSPGAA